MRSHDFHIWVICLEIVISFFLFIPSNVCSTTIIAIKHGDTLTIGAESRMYLTFVGGYDTTGADSKQSDYENIRYY